MFLNLVVLVEGNDHDVNGVTYGLLHHHVIDLGVPTLVSQRERGFFPRGEREGTDKLLVWKLY